MKGVLLDTDTISYFFRGTASVKEKIDQYLGEELNMSVIFSDLRKFYYQESSMY